MTEKDEQIEVLLLDAAACDEEMERLRKRVEELESFVELATTLRRKDSA